MRGRSASLFWGFVRIKFISSAATMDAQGEIMGTRDLVRRVPFSHNLCLKSSL